MNMLRRGGEPLILHLFVYCTTPPSGGFGVWNIRAKPWSGGDTLTLRAIESLSAPAGAN